MDPVQSSAWTPALITTLISAVFVGFIGLIGAVTALYVAIKGQRREEQASAARTTTQLAEVHSAVNGTNSALQERISRLSAELAALKPSIGNLARAQEASANVDAKAKITAESSELRVEAAKTAEGVKKS